MLGLKRVLKSALRGRVVCAMLLFVCCFGNTTKSVAEGNLSGLNGHVTGLVLNDDEWKKRPMYAWLTCKTQKKESCKGYIFTSDKASSGVGYNNWFSVAYEDCWYFVGLASAGWFASKDSLKIGWSGMEGDGVVGWSFLFSGTYKVSCNTLTLSESGKEPVIYIRRSIPRQCNLLPK